MTDEGSDEGSAVLDEDVLSEAGAATFCFLFLISLINRQYMRLSGFYEALR